MYFPLRSYALWLQLDSIIFLFVLWNLGSEKMRIRPQDDQRSCFLSATLQSPKQSATKCTLNYNLMKLFQSFHTVATHAKETDTVPNIGERKDKTGPWPFCFSTTCIVHYGMFLFFSSCLNVAHGHFFFFFRYCTEVWKFKINSNLPTSADDILQC